MAACDTATTTTLSCRVLCDSPGFCQRGTTQAPTCVPNNTADACGPTCQMCPTRLNATVSCNGTSCVYACNATFHFCSDDNTCASDTNSARCTSQCIQCPTGETCVDNMCTPPSP